MKTKENADFFQMKDDEAEAFCKELEEYFFSFPYGSVPKTDLQEKLLYLFNKHSGGKLLNCSDLELELKLRVSRTRVQTIRRDIALKYDEYDASSEGLLERLWKMPQNQITSSGDKVLLVMDDSRVRDHLEQELRERQGIAFEYKRNRTIVELEAKDFLACLKKLLSETKKKEYSELKATVSKITIKQFVETIKNAGKTMAKQTVSVALPVLAEVFKKKINS